jgi:hypothetical protein
MSEYGNRNNGRQEGIPPVRGFLQQPWQKSAQWIDDLDMRELQKVCIGCLYLSDSVFLHQHNRPDVEKQIPGRVSEGRKNFFEKQPVAFVSR